MTTDAQNNSEAHDPDRYFATDHLTADLRGRSVRGGAIMFLTQAGRMVLAVISAAVLARLLNPEDFGLVAIVTAITALLSQFSNLGLAASIVQRREVNHAQISTLFWINAGFGVFLMALTAALAPAIAWLYEDQAITAITLALSVAFLFGGLTVQHEALLRRQMRFKSIAIIDVVSDATGIAAGITSAALGAGYWSLVILNLCTGLSKLLLTVAICRWRPTWPRRGSGVREMLAFGGYVTGTGMLLAITASLDRLLIGRFAGTAALGFFTRASFLLMIPLQRMNAAMQTVGIPALSRIQNDLERYRFFYGRAIQMVAAIGMPIVIFVFAAADPVVLALLGEKWTDSTPIVRALAPAALIQALMCVTNWAYLSLGHTHRQFRWSLVQTPLIAIAFVIGMQWGAVGVAAALSISRCALWPIEVAYCYRGTFLRISDLIRALARPLVAALFAGVVTFALDRMAVPQIVATVTSSLDDEGSVQTVRAIAALIFDGIVFTIVYCLVWLADPRGRQTLGELRRLAADLRPGSASQADSLADAIND